MNRIVSACTLLIAGLSLGLGGCVDQKKYDSLADTAATSGARLESVNQENQTLATSLDLKQRRIDELEAEVGQLRSINNDLNGQISGIRSKQQSLVDELGNIRLTFLDPETDRLLAALAAQYPDLIRYDPARGMLQFMADLTFDSGSDQVKPQARQGLQRLAQILAGSSASAYDVRLVGHTDSQRPTRSANRFPTNRHLSVARSIAVEEVLRTSGIPGSRVETSGWGEHRPVVENRASGGTPQNRRVEIFIVPGTGGMSGALPEPAFTSPSGTSTTPAPARPVARPREEAPMK